MLQEENKIFKLAIVTTHPIQYNSPFFRALANAQGIEIKVFFTWGQSKEKVYDRKFNKEIKWDIPLLDGFEYTFLKNTANRPDSSHFYGIKNPSAINEIRAYNPDAILVYGWSFISHIKIMRYFKGKIPVYFRGDSYLLDEVAGFKKVLRRLSLKLIYSYVDYAFYVGENNRNYFLKHGLKENKLIWVPHTVDNVRFKSFSTDALIGRAKFNLPFEGINILFTGKFERKKNPLLLLHAFKSINRNDVNLIFVGNGELEEELKRNAEGIANIYFLPFQNQTLMPLVYSSADIVVLPSSFNETWGLVINEAMACGKAVVVSEKVGCGVDLVKPDINGYIFKQDNVEDLVEKLQNCLSDYRYVQFGKASESIIENWTIAKGVEIMIKALICTK